MTSIYVKLRSVFALFLGMCFCQPSRSLEGRIRRPLSVASESSIHNHPECLLDFPLITQANTIAYRDSNVYSLNTTFIWGDRNTSDISYEIGFARVKKLSRGAVNYDNCRPIRCSSMLQTDDIFCKNVSWQNTSTNQISLEAPYSFEFYLFIRPWNRTSGIYWSAIYHAFFPYEDCFEATSDREFCSKLDVDIASYVVDLTVNIEIDKKKTIIANVTWLEPAQVSADLGWGRLSFFAVRLDIRETNGINTHYNISRIPYSGPNPSLIYSAVITLQPLGVAEEYRTYYVQVVPAFDNDGNLQGGLAEHFAFMEFNITRGGLILDKSTSTVASSVLHSTAQMPPSHPNSIIILCVSALGVFSLAFLIFLIQRCFPSRRPIFIPAADEVLITGCLPVFAEKELYSVDRVKYAEDSLLGTGQYGSVYKGEVYNVGSSKDWTVAAIKVAKENEIGWKEDFLDEIKLILELGPHPNIIEVLGCCTLSDPPLLITEYMKYGDLVHFLHKCRTSETEEDTIYSLTESSLVFIALQVARGMEFMSASKFYHGDLAARNILITDGLVAKVADFGLSGALNERGYKRMAHGRRRPMRWVSLETLQSDYCSHYSDVWSYGVLLYEIFTFGATPYHDIPIHELSLRLLQGYRLPQPCICPQEIYKTMLQCWMVIPSERPSFSELKTVLECYQQMAQTPEGDYVGTSADSFISNPDLRCAIFQPFLEEDEIPSLPVATTVLRDSHFTGGSESMVGSESVVDSGFVVDSRNGSIDTMCLETLGEKNESDTGTLVKDLGVDNLGFSDIENTGGCDGDDGDDDDDDDTNVVSETNSKGISDGEVSDTHETSFSIDEDDDGIMKG